MKTKIENLKKSKKAIILAHYYVRDEVQQIADFVGDSLELARKAATTDAEIIIFAGVHFMAETAKILSPDKKVLIPDITAGCPLADSMKLENFMKFKQQYSDYLSINYVNSTAEIKAESDLICTSANAVDLVKSLPKDTKIIFGPDKNLGIYVKSFVENEMVFWEGGCPVHQNFSVDKLVELKLKYPKALVLAHPESNKQVLLKSDFIGSTSKILKFATENKNEIFIIATEPGIIYQMKILNPHKTYIPLPPITNHEMSVCYNMKKHSVEKVFEALQQEKFEIDLDKNLIKKANIPIQRMMDISLKLGLIK